jgi:hypothetical protein
MIQQARHMVDSTTRLYSIKVKDAETGATLNFTAADWSGDDKRLAVTEKRLAMAIISRLTARRPTPAKARSCSTFTPALPRKNAP